MAEITDAIAWDAANEGCDCKVCVAVREQIATDPTTPHYAAVRLGVTILMRMIYQGHCSACGWESDWFDDIEPAEAECEVHNQETGGPR